VDSHTHIGIFFDEISREWVSYTVNDLEDWMNIMDVGKSIVSNLSGTINPVEANIEVAELCFKDSRFVPLLWISPKMNLGEVRTLMHYGKFKGFKIHPTLLRCKIDDLTPFFRESELNGIPILIHCGEDEYSNAEAIEESVLRRFPSMTLVIAHMNLYGSAEKVVKLSQQYPNVFLETSWATLGEVKMAIKNVGAGKVIWGSDAPLVSKFGYFYDRVLDFINKNVEDKQRELIVSENARCVFNLE